MGYTDTEGRRFRRSRVREGMQAADVELGITDRTLHWRAAMVLIYGAERSYDTFVHLTHGVIAGDRLVKLGTVPRPGGRMVLESQVKTFLAAFEQGVADSEKKSKDETFERQGLTLAGTYGKNGMAGGPTQGRVGSRVDASA
jgi:hypothetical protein